MEHSCPDNRCFWEAMRCLGSPFVNKNYVEFFQHKFEGFNWHSQGHHPIEWSNSTIDAHRDRLKQLEECLREARPGLVDMIFTSEILEKLRSGPLLIAGIEEVWKDFFKLSLSVVGKPYLHHRVPWFYPELTPEALEPFARVFHARKRSDAFRVAQRAADIIMAFKEGTLMIGSTTVVEHLSLNTTSSLLIFKTNQEKAEFYQKYDWKGEWKQKVGNKDLLSIKDEEEKTFPRPWKRLDSLVANAMRGVCQHWGKFDKEKKEAINRLLSSWSVIEPRKKKARKK